jgi:probable blue pigment (indigoidine) exporter
MRTTPQLMAGPFLPQPAPSTRRLLAIASTGPILLGSAYVLTGLLPAEPLWNAAIRVLPAGLMLLAIHPALPHGPWLRRSLLLGILNFGGFFATQAFALHRIPGGVAATIAALQAVMVPVAASAVLGDRLRPAQIGAAAAGVLGVALLVLRSSGSVDSTGIGASLLLAVLTTAGLLLTRRWGLPPGVTHTTATAWQMLAGGLLLLPAALIIEGRPPAMTLAGWSVVAWLAIGATALAFAAVFGALHEGLPATSLSRLMLLCPLVATAAGWIAYHQSLTLLQTLGAGIVLASVATVCSSPKPPKPAPRAVDRVRIPAPRQPEGIETFRTRTTGRHRAGSGRHRAA